MSIMLFVILLHLLVARAINTRVESPPRLVLLTGRRYRVCDVLRGCRNQLGLKGTQDRPTLECRSRVRSLLTRVQGRYVR